MSNSTVNIESLIRQHSLVMADQMREIAAWARSEEDVRHECNKLLDAFLQQAGLRVKGRHEHHIGSGRLDSKYQGVLLEYKHSKGPGRIDEKRVDHPGNKRVIDQLKQRFVDFEREQKYRPERLFGVGCDGDTFIFVRYSNGVWDVEKPLPATPYSVERLLRALVSLGAQGYPFTPDHLAEHFGSESSLAQKGIRGIYQVISETKSRKATTLFDQWKILFGEVCGYDVEGRNEKIGKLAGHYGLPKRSRAAELLFAVHSYYAIFMKFLAAAIAASFSPLGITVLKKCVCAPTSSKLREEIESLEQGGIWSQLGIRNFLEGDLFSWYLAAWDDRIADVIRDIVRTLDSYDPSTLSVEPAESRDLLKKLYQHLFPKSVRHDLGEYYTPDWLAEHLLNEVRYEGDPDQRLLDPACGSGTFLVMAINRIKTWYEAHQHECGYDETELIGKILKNVVGFDLNPLAVMAARTNYLLAVRDLLKFSTDVELPVYLCDSIMTPAEYGDLFAGDLGKVRKLKTSAGEFLIPTEVASSRERIGKYTEIMEASVRKKYSAADFLARCRNENVPITEDRLHRELYSILLKLDGQNQNGIWARIIKNAFAPLFIDRVDIVVGNPPWVNWEYLPSNYRSAMSGLWRRYGFFVHKGMKAVLPAGHLDLSALFTYACIDVFTKQHGKLAFVITNTVFKSKGSGMGFRRLALPDGKPLRVLSVHDLAQLTVFEGAANYTSTVVMEKGCQNKYPVPYRVWRGEHSNVIPTSATLSDVLSLVTILEQWARPSDSSDSESAWTTGSRPALKVIEKIQGTPAYRARMGVTSDGADGVYWVDVIQDRGSRVVIRNRPDLSKRKPPHAEAVVERNLVFPLVRGGNIRRWESSSSLNIIVPHDPKSPQIGIGEGQMKVRYPLAYAYLERFQGELERRGFLRKIGAGRPFFSLWKIGPYTFVPYKVAWRRMATELDAVVLSRSGERLLVPSDTVTFIPLEDEREAHYCCAVLNSGLVRLAIASSTGAGRGFGSPSVLKNVNMPKYSKTNDLHNSLAALSVECHTMATKGESGQIPSLEADINALASKLWGISSEDMESVDSALHDIHKSRRPGRTKRLKTGLAAVSAQGHELDRTKPSPVLKAAEPGGAYIDDFDVDQLIEALLLVVGRGEWARDDAIRAAARQIGFKRVGSKIRDSFKSALNSAIRRGLISYDRDKIWKA